MQGKWKLSIYPIFVLAALVSLVACKKDPPPPPPPDPLIGAQFSIQHMCTVTELTVDSINYRDSIFRFTNLSDTGKDVTYKWAFGDGSTSTAIHPTHSYHNSGLYTVNLYTYYQGRASDTATRGIRVIIGQKKYNTGRWTNTVDIAPADNNGIMLLVHRTDNFGDPPVYNFIKTDSVLEQVSIRTVSGNSSRLENLERLSDGNYIAAGNYSAGNTNQFSISKINAQGDHVWTKFIPNTTGKNVYAAPTSDNGILTIGNITYVSPFGTTWFHTAIIKCDANGNEIWRKFFNTGQEITWMSNPLNFVEVNGEYVFASQVRFPTDSLILTRIDASGNQLQRQKTGLNIMGTIFGMGIAKAGNTFMVYMNNTNTAGLFNADLSFRSYKEVAQTSINDITAKDNKFYIVDGNFQYAHATQLNEDGSSNWDVGLGGWIRIDCSGLMTGATRYGRSVLFTPSGDIVAATHGQDNPSGSGSSSSSYLYRLTPAGAIR